MGLEDEASDQTDEGKSLDEGDTQEHGGAQLAGHLGLACHALERLTNKAGVDEIAAWCCGCPGP